MSLFFYDVNSDIIHQNGEYFNNLILNLVFIALLGFSGTIEDINLFGKPFYKAD
jgi:hypothetical protein